ncbi:MAG TPA: hypothetical protein VGL84_02300, partial [Gaiellaceae bacterium]
MAPLRTVDAEGLEAGLNVFGQAGGRPVPVVQGDHSDGVRFSVATHGELDRAGRSGRLAQRVHHR